MRVFTILFMAALAIGATVTIGPAVLGMATSGPVMTMAALSMSVFLGGFWLAFFSLLFPQLNPFKPGTKPVEQGETVRIQTPNVSPWHALFIGAIFLPVVFMLALIFAGGDQGPSLGIVVFVWLLLFAAIAAMPLHMMRRRQRGDFDIVIDKARKTIALPATLRRKSRETFAFSSVSEIRLEEAWTGAGRGRRFLSTIYLAIDGTRREDVAAFTHDSDGANALLALVRAHTGIPERPA